MAKIPAFLSLLFCCFFSLTPLRAEEDLEPYRAAMRQLAEECRAAGMELEAKVTLGRVWEDPENGFFVPRLPDRPQNGLPEDVRPPQREWFEKMRRIETECGTRLLARARELAAAGKGREAYEAARKSLFVDPDNEEARRIFGYHLHEVRISNISVNSRILSETSIEAYLLFVSARMGLREG